MTITIINMEDAIPVDFKIDNDSPLRNPFTNKLGVHKLYTEYLGINLNPDEAPMEFLETLDEILQAAQAGDITLGYSDFLNMRACQVIKKYLDVEVAKGNNDVE